MKKPSFLGKLLFTVFFLCNFLYAAEEDTGRLSALISDWVTTERDRARCVFLARAQGIDTDNVESQCQRCQRRLWSPPEPGLLGLHSHTVAVSTGFPGLQIDYLLTGCARGGSRSLSWSRWDPKSTARCV